MRKPKWQASVCLVTALSLVLPPNLFAQGAGPSDPAGQDHLRSTQVQDDSKNNSTLAGLEQALHRADREAAGDVATSTTPTPSSAPSGNFWAGRGQGPLASASSPAAGAEEFVIGGVNTNDAIDQLTEIAGYPITDREVLKRDNTFVLSRELTHQQLAAPLLRAINTANGNQQFMVNGKMFSVRYQGVRDWGNFTVTDDETGGFLQFSHSAPRYIWDYGFYGDGPHRIEPQSIIDLFGLKPGQAIRGPSFDRVELESVSDPAGLRMRTPEGQEIIGIPPFRRDQREDLSSKVSLPGETSFELVISKEYALPYQGELRGLRAMLVDHPAGKGERLFFDNVERMQFDPKTGILRIAHFKGREERLEFHADGRPKLVHFNASDAALVVAALHPDGRVETEAHQPAAGMEEIFRPGRSARFLQWVGSFLMISASMMEAGEAYQSSAAPPTKPPVPAAGKNLSKEALFADRWINELENVRSSWKAGRLKKAEAITELYSISRGMLSGQYVNDLFPRMHHLQEEWRPNAFSWWIEYEQDAFAFLPGLQPLPRTAVKEIGLVPLGLREARGRVADRFTQIYKEIGPPGRSDPREVVEWIFWTELIPASRDLLSKTLKGETNGVQALKELSARYQMLGKRLQEFGFQKKDLPLFEKASSHSTPRGLSLAGVMIQDIVVLERFRVQDVLKKEISLREWPKRVRDLHVLAKQGQEARRAIRNEVFKHLALRGTFKYIDLEPEISGAQLMEKLRENLTRLVDERVGVLSKRLVLRTAALSAEAKAKIIDTILSAETPLLPEVEIQWLASGKKERLKNTLIADPVVKGYFIPKLQFIKRNAQASDLLDWVIQIQSELTIFRALMDEIGLVLRDEQTVQELTGLLREINDLRRLPAQKGGLEEGPVGPEDWAVVTYADAGLEEDVRIVALEQLRAFGNEQATRLAAEAEQERFSHVVLIDNEQIGKPTAPQEGTIHLYYTDKDVQMRALGLLPTTISESQIEYHRLPSDPLELKARLQDIPENEPALVALDVAMRGSLPERHPLVLLLDQKWEGHLAYQEQLRVLLNRPIQELRNLVVFLTEGTVRPVKIGDRNYTAIFA